MKLKSKILSILFIFIITSVIFTLLNSLSLGIGLVLAISSIPAVFYSLYSGLKEYDKFFFEKKASIQEDISGSEQERVLSQKLSSVDWADLEIITFPSIEMNDAIFDRILSPELIFKTGAYEIEFVDIYEPIYSTTDIDFVIERPLSRLGDLLTYDPERKISILPPELIITAASVAY